MLAALGVASVTVHARPRVALVTTGDELVAVGEPLPFGGVYDSGAVVLPALIAGAGAETVSVAHVHDAEAAVCESVAQALEADVAVICGGMSVGAHDHGPAALARLDVEVHFAGVALKPGRPALFGTRGTTLVFGLPGNPVSSFVTFLLFVRPALQAVERNPGRTEALRCTLELREEGWWVRTTGSQGSHVLSSMLTAEAFALIPPGDGWVEPGSPVAIELV